MTTLKAKAKFKSKNNKAALFTLIFTGQEQQKQ